MEEGRTQFVVQWEEHAMQLATRLGYLLEHQSLVDVTLMCNTHTLKVHRAVLAACSPYFERQLGNHPLIVLKDMKFSVLKSLVEFMYCGETSVSEDNLSPLLEAAKFFEVKGLAAMTKESVCHSNGSGVGSVGTGSFGGSAVVTSPTGSTNNTGVGCRSGLVNSTGSSSVRGVANVSANSSGSGNVSWSGNGVNNMMGRGGLGYRGRGRGRGRPPLSNKVSSPTESAQILLSLSTPPNQTVQASNATQLVTTSKNIKIDVAGALDATASSGKVSSLGGRRRGRRRSAYNTAIRERILAAGSGNNDTASPLLSSLLTSPVSGSTSAINTKDIPILYENGKGELVKLPDPSPHALLQGDSDPNLNSTQCNEDVDRQINHLDDTDLEAFKTGFVSETESDPEAVVLFEVTDNKKVQKCVLSANDINTMKLLNEQLSQQKKQLADMTRDDMSTLAENPAVTELKFKISKTMSLLAQIMKRFQGFKGIKDLSKQALLENEQKGSNRVVELEFIDGNGDKIEGYKVEGTVVDPNEAVRVKEDPMETMAWEDVEDYSTGYNEVTDSKEGTTLDAMMPVTSTDEDYIVAYAAEEEVVGNNSNSVTGTEEYTVIYGGDGTSEAETDIADISSHLVDTSTADEYTVINDYTIDSDLKRHSPNDTSNNILQPDELLDSS